MNLKRGIVLVSSGLLSLVIFLASANTASAQWYCGGSHTETWTTWGCSVDKKHCVVGPPQTQTVPCTVSYNTEPLGCQYTFNKPNSVCNDFGGTDCQVGISGSAGKDGCFIFQSSPPPGASPTPAPPGGCSSNWCTTVAECNAVGGTNSPGTGYCNPASLVRCCPPGQSPPYVPGCPWDTGPTGYGYPACKLGDGNTCEPTLCVPFGNNCQGASCAPGLVGPPCFCPPDPVCTIKVSDPIYLNVGASVDISPTTTQTNGVVTSISFTSGDATKLSATSPDNASPFSSTLTGKAFGSTGITMTATMKNNANMSEGPRCSYTATVFIEPPSGWWQVKDGDVVAGGNLQSLIPSTCTLPGCNPNFILDGTGTYPGVAVYGGSTADFSATSTGGTVSSKNWLANSAYTGKTYNYAYFEGQIPSDAVINDISSDTVAGGFFNAGGTPSKGYVWYRRNGDLTINGNLNLTGSRKVILLVNGGNLTINGNMNIQTPGQGFIMAIVGKDAGGNKGDINIDQSVGGGATANIEGMYLADHQIKTGAGSSRLYVRGVLVGNEGVILERDLGAANSTTPGEFIEYAPDLLFSYPRNFSRSRVTWHEVAP